MTECGYKNSSSKFIMAKALKWGMLHLFTLIFQYDIHKNASKNKYYHSNLIHRTSERSSYLSSLCTTMNYRLNVMFSLLTYVHFLARVHMSVAWFSVAPKITVGRRQLSFVSKYGIENHCTSILLERNILPVLFLDMSRL